MIIPIFILRSLTLKRREISALFFVFAIGAVVICCAVLRFTYLLASTHGLGTQKTSGMTLALLSNAEMGCALLAACLPAMRVLLQKPEVGYSWWGALTGKTGRTAPMAEGGGAGGSERAARLGVLPDLERAPKGVAV